MRDGNLLPRKQRTAERILVGDAAGAERRGEERSERTVKGSGRERERERERDVLTVWLWVRNSDRWRWRSDLPELAILRAFSGDPSLGCHRLLAIASAAHQAHGSTFCTLSASLLLPVVVAPPSSSSAHGMKMPKLSSSSPFGTWSRSKFSQSRWLKQITQSLPLALPSEEAQGPLAYSLSEKELKQLLSWEWCKEMCVLL